MTTSVTYLETVATHPSADIYAKAWGTVREFNHLPTVSRAIVRATPLSKRLYSDAKGQTKIVHDAAGSFLSTQTFEDIRSEQYGLQSTRPLISFKDGHEAVEKSIWCYMHGILPLVAETNPDIASFQAETYSVDAIIGDSYSLQALRPYIESRKETLECIVVVDASFVIPELLFLSAHAARVNLVLSLPETGAFAESLLSENPTFRPLPHCLLQKEKHLVLTKERQAFPLIRYDTGLSPDVLC